jgi:hypothetical protein
MTERLDFLLPVTRDDIEGVGFDPKKVDDATLQDLTDLIEDDFCGQYGDLLAHYAEVIDLKKLPE